MTSRGAVTAAPARPGAARLAAADTPASRIALRARRRVDRLGRPRAGAVPDGVVVCRTSVLLLGCGSGRAPRWSVRAVSADPLGAQMCWGERDSGPGGVPGETGHWSRTDRTVTNL